VKPKRPAKPVKPKRPAKPVKPKRPAKPVKPKRPAKPVKNVTRTKKTTKQPARTAKQAARKRTPTTKAAPATFPFPFPFLGQGDAHYYEWFEMWIWFAEPVPRNRRKELLAGAPPPCTLDAQWPDPSLLWASTGDQWIQQHLIESYGSKRARAKYVRALTRQAAGDDDDDVLDDLIAAGDEEQAFNAHIERWLREMHAKRPILFAARREDGEAGGTALGAWHAASLQLFRDQAAPALAPLARGKLAKDDLRRAPIAIALAYVDPATVPPAVRKLGERG
jgi:hypothetical protein